MATLHITNGDVVAEGLAAARLDGTVIPWRDVLHEGPTPAGNPEQFRQVRARFIANEFGESEADVLASFTTRDAALQHCDASTELVLWFEPDLYDQLQLADVLSRIARKPVGERPLTRIVPADCLLGPLEHERFAGLFERRRALSEQDVALGAEAWNAITADTPVALAQFVTRGTPQARSYDVDDHTTLPYLVSALSRWLEELPSTSDGLSRSERQICHVLENGVRTLGYTFQQSHHAVESWAWLGDTTFAKYVHRLSKGSQPLIAIEGNGGVVMPRDARSRRTFTAQQARLTDFGRTVLANAADAIEANGIDRWFGGTHLTTTHHWRWDHGAFRIVEVGD